MLSICSHLLGVFAILLLFYQVVFFLVPFWKKQTPHKCSQLHRYAVLIAARNEESVIRGLIESIHEQTYSSQWVDVFVVADNCSDRTAQIACSAGAIVWERSDKMHVGKGYALRFLLERIEEYRQGNAPYDGYFVFDADNRLHPCYIEEMNKSFSDGNPIVTSYRNSTNFDGNWISSGYAVNFLRESQFVNRSRMLLGTSCAVSGTGFLFSREVLEKLGGWNFFLLTEDIQFSLEAFPWKPL